MGMAREGGRRPYFLILATCVSHMFWQGFRIQRLKDPPPYAEVDYGSDR